MSFLMVKVQFYEENSSKRDLRNEKTKTCVPVDVETQNLPEAVKKHVLYMKHIGKFIKKIWKNEIIYSQKRVFNTIHGFKI